MKSIFRILLIFSLVRVFILILFIFSYAKSQKAPVVYKTQTAFITNIARKTVATGNIIPRKEVFIKPQVSGIIECYMLLQAK